MGGSIYSAIHKAAVQRSVGGSNDLRDPFQPPAPLTASGMEWWKYTVADLRGARGTRPPGSKFCQFHAVFGKIWQIRMLAPPPRGNPGSATGISTRQNHGTAGNREQAAL